MFRDNSDAAYGGETPSLGLLSTIAMNGFAVAASGLASDELEPGSSFWTGNLRHEARVLGESKLYSNAEIADELGCSINTIAAYLDQIGVRNVGHRSKPLPEHLRSQCVDTYEADVSRSLDTIAELVGQDVSPADVRRAIEDHEAEPEPSSVQVSGMLHLKQLYRVHPDRFYEDDPEAEAEFADQSLPMKAREIPFYLP